MHLFIENLLRPNCFRFRFRFCVLIYPPTPCTPIRIACKGV